ncbi:hypothetical protein CKO27_17645 [Thiocystis violacea]|nr:hypothetical protein [Thiocystis violacea]
MGDSSEARAAVAAWESLWSELAERGESALRPETADASLRAAGDTAFMRYRNLWGQIEGDERLAFQLAALSGDPERKLARLRPLTEAGDPRVLFRAHLELARLHLRRRAFAPAREAARAALAVPEIPERIRSDAHFILGYLASEEARLDQAETALTAAIVADPGFWDARQLRLAVLARRLAQPGRSGAECLDRTRRMIEDLGALPALAQDRTQFRDIADRFATQGAPANAALALLSGLGYLWSGDLERARTTLTGAETLQGRLPAACERLILRQVAAWIPPAPADRTQGAGGPE